MAKDVWGKNDGKIVGAKIDTGLVNEALKFDGKDDYVNVTDFSSIDYAELTVEARFKVNQTNSNGLVTQNQGDTGGGDFFNIYTSGNILRFGLRAKDNSTWHQPNKPFTDTKEWHHFIAVYNGKKSIFYLGGCIYTTTECVYVENNPIRIIIFCGGNHSFNKWWQPQVNRSLNRNDIYYFRSRY